MWCEPPKYRRLQILPEAVTLLDVSQLLTNLSGRREKRWSNPDSLAIAPSSSRDRNNLEVARIIDRQVVPGEARCRAGLTKMIPPGKCRTWIREFVWLANKHLVVLDIVETTTSEIRRQWQLHVPNPPSLGDRIFTVTNRPPKQRWFDPTIQPGNMEGRLFCQTILPRQYRMVLHSDGKVKAYDPAGKPIGPVEGDRYHRDYGQYVVQIDPGHTSERTIFLHVLTAVDAVESTPSGVKFREIERGNIELTIDGATTRLTVAE